MSEAMLLARNRKKMVPTKKPVESSKIYGMELSIEEKVKQGKTYFLFDPFLELGYDSDLIIDEEDYKNLQKLPNIEQEKIKE